MTTTPSTIVLAKTGTINGRPALVAYEGKQTVLFVLPAEEGSDWSEIDRSPHSGIRGLGQMMKKLDKDSARNPSDAPAWAASASAHEQVEVAPAVEPAPTEIVADATPEAVEVTVEPVATEPVVEVAVSPLAGFLPADVISEIATTADLAFLRAAREEAARAGAGPDALRVISLRAGELVLGFNPAALKRKAAKPAAAPTEKAPRAPRPEGATRARLMGIREMMSSGRVAEGDTVTLRGNPEVKTTITANGDSADGGTLCAWTKRVTGWSAVDIYSNLIHAQSGKLLKQLR